MTWKIPTLILGFLVILGLGIKRSVNSSQADKRCDQANNIEELARNCKSQGKSRVVIPGPIIDYPGENSSFEEMATQSSAVIAEPIASKSDLYNPYSIGTWYKFRIIEPLLLRPPKHCDGCPPMSAPPEELSSLLSNELLLAVDGGSLSIGGVEITQTSGCIPSFEKGEKYLLFVSFLPGGIARLAAGPSGIFKLVDQDSLKGVDTTNRKAYDDVKNRFGSKLSLLRSHISQ
jgi:hypothetical protein